MERDNQTLPVWLGTFKTAHGADWGGLMAASTCSRCRWSSSRGAAGPDRLRLTAAGAVKG